MARAEAETKKKKGEQKESDRPNLWVVTTVIAGCGLLLIAIFGGHGLMRWLQSDQEKKTLTAQLVKIEGKNSLTRREIDSLLHNGNYIELIARRDLGMVKADEIIYQFLPRAEQPESIQPLPAGQ